MLSRILTPSVSPRPIDYNDAEQYEFLNNMLESISNPQQKINKNKNDEQEFLVLLFYKTQLGVWYKIHPPHTSSTFNMFYGNGWRVVCMFDDYARFKTIKLCEHTFRRGWKFPPIIIGTLRILIYYTQIHEHTNMRKSTI